MQEPRRVQRVRAGRPAARRHRRARPAPWRRNAVVLPDGTDADVFALAEDELEAAVQVFHVRDGRVRGQRGWVVEKVEDAHSAELVEQLLQQVYGGEAAADAVPREVLVPALPAERRPAASSG